MQIGEKIKVIRENKKYHKKIWLKVYTYRIKLYLIENVGKVIRISPILL